MDATVFLVDDDPAMRSSLGWVFASVGYTSVQCSSAHQFLREYSGEARGCIVTDLRMPGMSGLELLTELRVRAVDLPVVMITGFADVDVAVRAFKAGAFDFLEKPFSDQHLIEVVERAIRADEAWHRVRQVRDEIETRMARLTDREREILRSVVAGKSSRVTATELGLSSRTVEVHRVRIMTKMGVGRVVDLVRALTATRIARAGAHRCAIDTAAYDTALRAELQGWLPEHVEQSVSQRKQ